MSSNDAKIYGMPVVFSDTMKPGVYDFVSPFFPDEHRTFAILPRAMKAEMQAKLSSEYAGPKETNDES